MKNIKDILNTIDSKVEEYKKKPKIFLDGFIKGLKFSIGLKLDTNEVNLLDEAYIMMKSEDAINKQLELYRNIVVNSKENQERLNGFISGLEYVIS